MYLVSSIDMEPWFVSTLNAEETLNRIMAIAKVKYAEEDDLPVGEYRTFTWTMPASDPSYELWHLETQVQTNEGFDTAFPDTIVVVEQIKIDTFELDI